MSEDKKKQLVKNADKILDGKMNGNKKNAQKIINWSYIEDIPDVVYRGIRALVYSTKILSKLKKPKYSFRKPNLYPMLSVVDTNNNDIMEISYNIEKELSGFFFIKQHIVSKDGAVKHHEQTLRLEDLKNNIVYVLSKYDIPIKKIYLENGKDNAKILYNKDDGIVLEEFEDTVAYGKFAPQ